MFIQEVTLAETRAANKHRKVKGEAVPLRITEDLMRILCEKPISVKKLTQFIKRVSRSKGKPPSISEFFVNREIERAIAEQNLIAKDQDTFQKCPGS